MGTAGVQEEVGIPAISAADARRRPQAAAGGGRRRREGGRAPAVGRRKAGAHFCWKGARGWIYRAFGPAVRGLPSSCVCWNAAAARPKELQLGEKSCNSARGAATRLECLQLGERSCNPAKRAATQPTSCNSTQTSCNSAHELHLRVGIFVVWPLALLARRTRIASSGWLSHLPLSLAVYNAV